MLIRMGPPSSRDDLRDHLLRLGCTVSPLGDERLDVRVTHPETVEDEHSSLAEWCLSWVESPRERGRRVEIAPDATGDSRTLVHAA